MMSTNSRLISRYTTRKQIGLLNVTIYIYIYIYIYISNISEKLIQNVSQWVIHYALLFLYSLLEDLQRPMDHKIKVSFIEMYIIIYCLCYAAGVV